MIVHLVTLVVLAAGKGTRMKSPRPKVLHLLAGRSMIDHVLAAAADLRPERVVVVLAPDMTEVAAAVARAPQPAVIVFQEPQLGTGHALMTARDHLPPRGDVLVLYADTPLLTLPTSPGCSRPDAPPTPPSRCSACGRPIPRGTAGSRSPEGELAAIVEERHADDGLRRDGCAMPESWRSTRPGSVCCWRPGAEDAEERVLPDRCGRARPRPRLVLRRHRDAVARGARRQLAGPARRGRGGASGPAAPGGDGRRRHSDRARDRVPGRRHPARSGRRDRAVRGVRARRPGGARRPHPAVLPPRGRRDRRGRPIGPFARLRPDTEIGAGARVGNFVEIKNATLEPGAKANHLSYLGDARVGAKANIGAGTITCNYDGFAKHRTDIGAGAFIGSNTALVAPVTVGEGAVIGAGSTINRDVPPGSLSIARGRQTDIPDGAARLRARRGCQDLALVRRRYRCVASLASSAGSRPLASCSMRCKRLEYRGYDSAGMATLVNGRIERRRAEGKLANLERVLEAEPLPGRRSASGTPAGRPTARRPATTRIRTRRAASPWCTTASSRTSRSCATS